MIHGLSEKCQHGQESNSCLPISVSRKSFGCSGSPLAVMSASVQPMKPGNIIDARPVLPSGFHSKFSPQALHDIPLWSPVSSGLSMIACSLVSFAHLPAIVPTSGPALF
jgi:hypothetical protein